MPVWVPRNQAAASTYGPTPGHDNVARADTRASRLFSRKVDSTDSAASCPGAVTAALSRAFLKLWNYHAHDVHSLGVPR